MFKKKEYAKIEISNVVSVEGYESGARGNMHVAKVDDLVIFKGLNAKKSNQGVRSLLVTVKIPKNSEVALKYGTEMIVISKKFTKLPKKQQLALLEIENQIFNNVDSRFISNMGADIVSTSKDKEISAQLLAAEKYGYRAVKKAVIKQHRLVIKTEKPIAKYLFKANKKGKKIADVEEMAIPLNLQNA